MLSRVPQSLVVSEVSTTALFLEGGHVTPYRHCACCCVQTLDLHAERLMYQTVLAAATPLPAASAPEAALPSHQLSIAGSGLAAASAAMSVLQTAAATGAATARLLLPVAGSGVGEAAGGLPGMLKSWAAETAGAAVMTQQQAPSRATLQLTVGSRGQQPAFTEQESRWVLLPGCMGCARLLHQPQTQARRPSTHAQHFGHHSN